MRAGSGGAAYTTGLVVIGADSHVSPTPDRIRPLPSQAPLLELSRATKLFGATVAMWRVDLQLGRGDGVGIVGGNGSGKTTLLRAVAGALELDVGHRNAAASLRTALLGHRTGLLDDLTVGENVRLFARGRGVGPRETTSLLARLRLDHVEHARVSSLSAGTRRRAGLARAMATSPDVLVLDEPFASVDAGHAAAITVVLTEWRARGGTLVVAAHDADALAPLCDRVHWLTAGRLLAPVVAARTAGGVS